MKRSVSVWQHDVRERVRGGFSTCRVIESDEDRAGVVFEAVRESGSEVEYELNELVPVSSSLGE